MKIILEKSGINLLSPFDTADAARNAIIFLHGFTGRAEDWSFLFDKLPKDFTPYAIDLPGHGESPSPDDPDFYKSESIIRLIKAAAEYLHVEKFVLAGYSMGGRAALSFAASFPEMLSGVILESSTPGIEDPDMRNERVKSDTALSMKIKSVGIKKFIDDWYAQPLFESLTKSGDFFKIRESRYNNKIAGLANSLSGFGSGVMPPVWDKLEKFQFPVLIISGEFDYKYSLIGNRMKDFIANSEHKILKDCGHAAHLEKPAEFINLVNEFLNGKIRKD